MVLDHPNQASSAGTYVVHPPFRKTQKAPIIWHCHRDLIDTIRRACSSRRQSPACKHGRLMEQSISCPGVPVGDHGRVSEESSEKRTITRSMHFALTVGGGCRAYLVCMSLADST